MTTRQALILAAGMVAASIVHAYAVSTITTPAAVNGCVFNGTPPTLTDGQTAPLSCDSTGKLRVTTSF